MLESDKNTFMGGLMTLALNYPKSPDFKKSAVFDTWWGMFKDLPLDGFVHACKATLEREEWFPSPARLKRFTMEIYESDVDIGVDIAARIEKAIGSYGYNNATAAEKYIGDIGWQVVDSLGGWVRVCDVNTADLASARKQWRDVATIVSRRLITTGSNNPVAIPSASKSPALDAAFKLIDGGKF